MLGYFGPEGTFTHQALLTLSSNSQYGADVTTATPFSSVAAALEAVRQGSVDAVMVPIENSVEGGVSATLDDLGDLDATPLQIIAETLVNVTFDLAVRPGTALTDIHKVITHSHAAAQTRAWVARTLPQATVVEQGSTAGAAKEVANPASEFDAAICAPVATELYGLTALAHDIADNEAGVTRFVLVSKRCDCPPPTGHDKTTLVAYLNADRSGALLEILQQFAVRGVNLCRIESRPTKTTLGSYCFSIDAEGHIDDARMAETLVGLKRVCQNVVFLGSYPRADEVASQIVDGARDSDYASAQTWVADLSGKEVTDTRPDFTVDPGPPASPAAFDASDHRLDKYVDMQTILYLSTENSTSSLTGIPNPWQAPADGVPLICQILVSQNSELIHSISSSQNGMTSITGDFQRGRDRLLTFLRKLADEDIFDAQQLRERTDRLASVLISPTPTPRHISLEIRHGAGTQIHYPVAVAKTIFDNLQSIDRLISRYLDWFRQLKATGQIDLMWLLLGLTERDIARWWRSGEVAPKSVSRPQTTSYQSSGARRQPVARVERPGGVTAVCVIEIVASILLIIASLILVATLASVSDAVSEAGLGGITGLAIFFLIVSIGMAIWMIALAVQMLNGSWMARRIFTVLVIVGWVLNIADFWLGQAWSFFLSLIIQAIILGALYTELASRFFEQNRDRRPVTRSVNTQPSSNWYH